MTQAANLGALGTNAGTTGIVATAGGGTGGTNGAIGFKNRIINGAMVIDQRNAGASVTVTTDKTFSCDRWMARVSASSKFSMQQDAGAVTPPVGFSDYLGVTSLAATSVGSSDYYAIQGVIEGYNAADFNWGSSNAKTITLSFWVRSSLTGTFGGSLTNYNNLQSYIFNYTVSTANTWEQKSITIVGPTTGTWNTTNSGAFNITFSLGVGSTFRSTANSWLSGNFFTTSGETQVVATNGATWYMTGAQLEVGTAATNFDVRSYGTELALCQRYYFVYAKGGTSPNISTGYYYESNILIVGLNFPVTMRANPSLVSSSNANDFIIYRSGAADGFDAFNGINEPSPNSANVRNGTQVSGTAGQAGLVICNNSTALLALNSEL
jgi:hypothetical protein